MVMVRAEKQHQGSSLGLGVPVEASYRPSGQRRSIQDGEIVAKNDRIIHSDTGLNWRVLRPRALYFGDALYCFLAISGSNKGHGMSNPDRKVAYVKGMNDGESWSQTAVLDVRMPDNQLVGFGLTGVPQGALKV
jgi:hypothetical protein